MVKPLSPKQQAKLSSLPKNISPEKRLEAAIFALSLTRQELADRLGISLSSIAMYLNGLHTIRKVVALAFEGCYGVQADWLLYGKKPVYVDSKEQGSRLSERAYECAVIYDSLPKEGQENVSILMPSLKRFYTKNKS